MCKIPPSRPTHKTKKIQENRELFRNLFITDARFRYLRKRARPGTMLELLSPRKHPIWISKGMISSRSDLLPTNRWTIYDVVCRCILRFHKRERRAGGQKRLTGRNFVFSPRSLNALVSGRKPGERKNRARIGGYTPVVDSGYFVFRIRLRVSRLRFTWGYYIFWHDYHIFLKRAPFFYRPMTTRGGHFFGLNVIDWGQFRNSTWVGPSGEFQLKNVWCSFIDRRRKTAEDKWWCQL